MSPTISILSTLSLLLISGSADDRRRENPNFPTLEDNVQYLWETYKLYSDELTFALCSARHVFKINNKSPMKVTGQNSSCTNVETTKSRQNLSSENITTDVDATTQLGKTWAEVRSRVKRYARSAVLIKDEHRETRRRSRMIRKRRTKNIKRALQAVSSNYMEQQGGKAKDENGRLAPMINHYTKRQRTLWMKLLRQALRGGHEFSSGTNSHVVKLMPNPKDDDKVDLGSTGLGKKNSRKVLRSSHPGLLDASASRSFSLKDIRLFEKQFPFRRSRKRNSRNDKMLLDPRTQQEHRTIERNPAGRRGPSNNDGSWQFRRTNADAEYPRINVVKSMDSEGDSSHERIINSRRKFEKLSRDLFLSLHEGSAVGGQSFLEFRKGEKVVKRNAHLQFKTVNGSEKRPEKEKKRNGRTDTSTAMIHPLLSSKRSSSQQTFHESHELSPIPTVSKRSRQDDDSRIRNKRSASSLYSLESFIENYKDSVNHSANSKLIISQVSKDSNRLSSVQRVPDNVHLFFVNVFGIMKLFFNTSWNIVNVLRINPPFICMKEFVSTKLVKWLKANNFA